MLTSNVFVKNSKPIKLAMLACAIALPSLVMAQDAPPHRDRVKPASTADAPNEAVPKPELVGNAEDDAALPTDPPAQAASAPVDPCPLPSAEMANAPDDLSKVQADIDRYTLCMERAQLLQRLNSVAMENQKALDAANGIGGVGAANPGMQLNNIPSFDDQRAQIMESVDAGAMETPAGETGAPPPSSDEWLVMKITGSGGVLSAQLGKTDGTLAQVKNGDSLPDGSSVESVSATSVSIKKDGENKVLRWRDDTSGATDG